jgi:hypothetical protein
MAYDSCRGATVLFGGYGASWNDETWEYAKPCPGDFDADGDVDLEDFAIFQACFNGPNRPPACQ